MGLTQQDILKAFYKLDQKNIPLRRVGEKTITDTRDIAARKQLCSEWLKAFADLETSLWDKVVSMALKECQEYPDFDKLYELITRAEQVEKEPVPPVPAKKPKTNKRTATNGQAYEDKLKKMFEAAKRGEFKAAMAIVSSTGITPAEIASYATTHWTGAKQDWIDENKQELERLIVDERRCSECQGLHKCKRFGYHDCGKIDKYTGNLNIMVTMCDKRMERENEKIS